MKKDKNKLIQRTLHTVAPLSIREADGVQSRTITGYAVRFGEPSAVLWNDGDHQGREVIAKGAITRDLLDKCDILMTMFHDRQLILARSKQGQGTLRYNVDAQGVSFEFDAPETADGDKALELVKRGDLDGCSFAFSTYYFDPDFVSRSLQDDGSGVVTELYTVNKVTGIYDFTITDSPAYPTTEVAARELAQSLRETEPKKTDSGEWRTAAQSIADALDQFKNINY